MIDPGLGNVVLGATQGSDTLVAFASGETLIGGIGNLAMFGDANNALYGG